MIGTLRWRATSIHSLGTAMATQAAPAAAAAPRVAGAPKVPVAINPTASQHCLPDVRANLWFSPTEGRARVFYAHDGHICNVGAPVDKYGLGNACMHTLFCLEAAHTLCEHTMSALSHRMNCWTVRSCFQVYGSS